MRRIRQRRRAVLKPRRAGLPPILVWRDVNGFQGYVHSITCRCDACEAEREAKHWQMVADITALDTDHD